MLIVSYDIANTKLRTKFSKYLQKFGFRLQFSVYEIRNSDHLLGNITAEIENNFKNLFTEADSVVIFILSATCKKLCFGNARHNDEDAVFVT